MDKRFDYKLVENKWREFWIQNKYGSTDKSKKEKFTMVIPPPNVTGRLHMGHALNNTFIDLCLRHSILNGKDGILIPGTDHAGIATQTKVEKTLLEEGITKESLGKEKFMEKVHEWKESHGGIIIKQLKEMGCLYDWKNEHFTMEPKFSKLVTDIFIRLYHDNLIYRSEYIVNWCPKHKTALANDEVIHNTVKSKLYYIKYKLVGEEDFITVATTRPETLLGDTAVAYHPSDDRYKHLKGKQVILPFVYRFIDIIEDDYVKPGLGTGLVKITPSHDFNDFEMGKRHNLSFIKVLDEDAHVCNTGTKYDGMYTLKARKEIVKDLEKLGQLDRIEEHENTNGSCYRCGDIIEPMISKQWFVRMEPLVEKARKFVDAGEVEFIPSHHKKIYDHWMNNIRDWCISRQIWWGHRIPVWYHKHTDEVICQETSPGEDYEQDPDVLDTWFSSWLWSFGVINDDEFDLRYPTDLLITGSDILFFWVSRMIVASVYLHDKVPFKRVYLHGIVRDEQGEKMSKSKGNVIDPMNVMKEYGADAMRMLLTMFSPTNRDIKYSPQNLKVSRNFLTKIWNTVRFYLDTFGKLHLGVFGRGFKAEDIDFTELPCADVWIITKFNNLLDNVNNSIRECNFTEYAILMYNFVFNVFCCHYLEYCKEMGVDRNSHYVFETILKNILIMLHPIVPFITEELWSKLNSRGILDSRWPVRINEDSPDKYDDFERTLEMLTMVRKNEIINIQTLIFSSNIKYIKLLIDT